MKIAHELDRLIVDPETEEELFHQTGSQAFAQRDIGAGQVLQGAVRLG